MYNDDNKEKVRHDEEQDRILKEVEQEKRNQDVRNSRLELLRKRKLDPSSSPTSVEDSSIRKDLEEQTDSKKIERFSLFPDVCFRETKKTKTQKEIEERDSWVKPVGFADRKTKTAPWYSKAKQKAEDTQSHDDLPTLRSVTKSRSLEELRRERLNREREEREKAEKLMRKR